MTFIIDEGVDNDDVFYMDLDFLMNYYMSSDASDRDIMLISDNCVEV